MAPASRFGDLWRPPASPQRPLQGPPAPPVPRETSYGDPSAYTARQRLNGALRDCGVSQAGFSRWSVATRGVPLDRYNEHWCDDARRLLREDGGAVVRAWLREEG